MCTVWRIEERRKQKKGTKHKGPLGNRSSVENNLILRHCKNYLLLCVVIIKPHEILLFIMKEVYKIRKLNNE